MTPNELYSGQYSDAHVIHQLLDQCFMKSYIVGKSYYILYHVPFWFYTIESERSVLLFGHFKTCKLMGSSLIHHINKYYTDIQNAWNNFLCEVVTAQTVLCYHKYKQICLCVN